MNRGRATMDVPARLGVPGCRGALHIMSLAVSRALDLIHSLVAFHWYNMRRVLLETCFKLFYACTTLHLTDGRTDGQTDGRTDARTHARTHARTDGRTHGRTDGRTDGRTTWFRHVMSVCWWCHQGTANVIQACVEHDVSRLVYTSTVDVVIGFDDIVNGDESCVTPRRFLFPGYPSTKHHAEMLVNNADGRRLAKGR